MLVAKTMEFTGLMCQNIALFQKTNAVVVFRVPCFVNKDLKFHFIAIPDFQMSSV